MVLFFMKDNSSNNNNDSNNKENIIINNKYNNLKNEMYMFNNVSTYCSYIKQIIHIYIIYKSMKYSLNTVNACCM